MHTPWVTNDTKLNFLANFHFKSMVQVLINSLTFSVDNPPLPSMTSSDNRSEGSLCMTFSRGGNGSWSLPSLNSNEGSLIMRLRREHRGRWNVSHNVSIRMRKTILLASKGYITFVLSRGASAKIVMVSSFINSLRLQINPPFPICIEGYLNKW